MIEVAIYGLAVIGVVALPALFFWSATTFNIREIGKNPESKEGKSHEKKNK